MINLYLCIFTNYYICIYFDICIYTVFHSVCSLHRFPLPSSFVKVVPGGDTTPAKSSKPGPWDALSDHLVRHNYLGVRGGEGEGDPFPVTPPRRGGQPRNSET